MENRVTCRSEQQGKGPGEGWSYGSMKERDGEKAKERDSMDCLAPVLACYPPGIHINVHTHTQAHSHVYLLIIPKEASLIQYRNVCVQ